jgi:hypothetical protein
MKEGKWVEFFWNLGIDPLELQQPEKLLDKVATGNSILKLVSKQS